MKVLVTGCAGFIGSHLCERLLAEGHEVMGIDNLSGNYCSKWPIDNMAGFIDNPKFFWDQEDILNLKEFPDVDCVFHLAAVPGVRDSWGENFERYLNNNILVTQRLLEHYARNRGNCKQFIFASSSSVYGCQYPLPAYESVYLYPCSPYGVSKLACEHLCEAYSSAHHLPIRILRFFSVYGPRQRPDMCINRFVRGIICEEAIRIYEGICERDFTYIDDVINACDLIMNHSGDYVVYNVGTGKKTSLFDLVHIIENATGKKAKEQQGPFEEYIISDVRITQADISRIQGLGYNPKTTIEEGVKKYVEWVKSK